MKAPRARDVERELKRIDGEIEMLRRHKQQHVEGRPVARLRADKELRDIWWNVVDLLDDAIAEDAKLRRLAAERWRGR